MEISIIIVTYKSQELLHDCFSSISCYNDLRASDIELIVVDNSPPEDAIVIEGFIKEQDYPFEIHYLKSENLGYGRGNNIGISVAKGEIIAVMNPDVRLTEPLFLHTLKVFKDENVASLGYQQINGITDFSFFRFPELFIPILYTYLNRTANRKKKFNQYKSSLSGAFVFFRKQDFIDIGMYDETMYMYLEEPETAKRINSTGKKIIFDGTKKYLHLMEHKDDFNERLLDIGTDSIVIYFKKNNLDLKKYIGLRILELRIHKFIFMLTKNKARQEKAGAYIKSLRKAYGK